MGSNSKGSTNAVDQLLGHADGPKSAPDKVEANRLKFSKGVVDVNFVELKSWCENIRTDGYIYLEDTDADAEDLRVNIYADIHNYLCSIYSLVEELHQVINQCAEAYVDNGTFVRGESRKNRSHPPFVRKLPFAWGLRNQFTHGNYRCLTIIENHSSHKSYLQLEFRKQQFDPRGSGDLQEVGDYLWGVDRHQEQNPMCYFAELYDDFIDFWTDTEDWLIRAAD